MVSSVKSTSPVASWEYPRTELAVPSFSLAGFFSWSAPSLSPWFLSLFYALFLVISLSLINIIAALASTHLSWTPNSSILNGHLTSPFGCLMGISNLMCTTLNVWSSSLILLYARPSSSGWMTASPLFRLQTSKSCCTPLFSWMSYSIFF